MSEGREGKREGGRDQCGSRLHLYFIIPSLPPSSLPPYLDLIFGGEEAGEMEEDGGREGAKEEGEEVPSAGKNTRSRPSLPPSLPPYLDLIIGGEEAGEMEEDGGREGAKEEGEEVCFAGIDAFKEEKRIFVQRVEFVFLVAEGGLKEGYLLLELRDLTTGEGGGREGGRGE